MITPTEWKEAQLEKPDMWESILGAVARGWCYEENANKTMDSELSVAIAKEVYALYTTLPYVPTERQRKPLDMTEIVQLTYDIDEDKPATMAELFRFARAIEAAHGIVGETHE